jgi:hypothetical protein
MSERFHFIRFMLDAGVKDSYIIVIHSPINRFILEYVCSLCLLLSNFLKIYTQSRNAVQQSSILQLHELKLLYYYGRYGTAGRPYSFALWARPRFLMNSSAPLYSIEKWLSCNTDYLRSGRNQSLDAGRRNLFKWVFLLLSDFNLGGSA